MYQPGVLELHVVGRQRRALLHQPLTSVHHDLAWAQQLAGEIRWARRGAAAALRAGVSIEQVLPAQMLDVGRPERLDVGLQIHRPHYRALGLPARVREEDVDE